MARSIILAASRGLVAKTTSLGTDVAFNNQMDEIEFAGMMRAWT